MIEPVEKHLKLACEVKIQKYEQVKKPSKSEIKALVTHDWVKLCFNDDTRFYVEIIENEDGLMTGRIRTFIYVKNHLKNYSYNRIIKFTGDHIYGILK